MACFHGIASVFGKFKYGFFSEKNYFNHPVYPLLQLIHTFTLLICAVLCLLFIVPRAVNKIIDEFAISITQVITVMHTYSLSNMFIEAESLLPKRKLTQNETST